MSEVLIILNKNGVPEKFVISGVEGKERRKAFDFTEHIRKVLIQDMLNEVCGREDKRVGRR
jgi:nicotinamide mononucleotide adenylyltransferase